MRCSECGFRIDELNESQPVCPSCGADANAHPRFVLDPKVLLRAWESAGITDPALKPGNDQIN